MSDASTLRQAFALQAEYCRGSNSPFSGLVLDTLAERIETYSGFLQPWLGSKQGHIFADAVPLRLLGAFHYLALSRPAGELATLFPPNPIPDASLLAAALERAAAAHGEVISRYMTSPPQTNEVARSLALAPGFLTVAAETGLPLRCLELGASAGLNMNWDLFHYDFRGAAWGDPSSPVQLSGDWKGATPPTPPARVAERAACDQNPIDVLTEEGSLRLQSYVWADQTVRLERLRAAIAVKRQTGGVPEKADAGEWAERKVHPQEGVATVVYHSSFIYYPPRDTQERIVQAITAAAARATPNAPLAWLSKEPPADNMAAPDEVRLRLWPQGWDRVLGRSHPHAWWVEWLG